MSTGTVLTVYAVDVVAAGPALEACETRTPRLSQTEEQRAAAMDDRRAEAWRAAHIALRLALERWGGPDLRRVAFEIGPAGRPTLPAAAPKFSLSHTTGLALIAVALPHVSHVGVDVEARRTLSLAPERRERLTRAGRAAAGGADADLIQAWTRLEAVGKALGIGVGPLLTATKPGYAPEAGGNDDVTHLMSAVGLAVRDLQLADGYAGALAAPAPLLPSAMLSHFPASPADLEAFAAARMAIDLAGVAGQKER